MPTPNTSCLTPHRPANDPRCPGPATSVGARRSSATRSRILTTSPALTVADPTLSACSVACPRSAGLARGKFGRLLPQVTIYPPPGECVLTSSSYIKELADRINTIEGKLNTNVDGLERSASNEAFASPGLVDESRKRPFSNISGDAFQTPPPNRFSSTFATDHRPILPYLQPEFRTPNSGGQTELGIKPAPPAPFPGATDEIGLQPQPEMMEGISQNGLPQGSSHQGDQMPEIEDAVFNR